MMNRRAFQAGICATLLVPLVPSSPAFSQVLSVQHSSNPVARVEIHSTASLSSAGLFYAESSFRNRHRLRGRTVTAFIKLMERDAVLAVIEQRAGLNARALGGSRKFASNSLQVPTSLVGRATIIKVDHFYTPGGRRDEAIELMIQGVQYYVSGSAA